MLERRFAGSSVAATGSKLAGYAAVYDSSTRITERGKAFTEIIRPGAFKRSLGESRDVLALFNHDPAKFLGRLSSGTLSLREDGKGLWFELDLPDTGTGNEVRHLVERGDLKGASVAFRVAKEKWIGDTRELLDLDLFDVSPVIEPAYSATVVSLRSRMDFMRLHQSIIALRI